LKKLHDAVDRFCFRHPRFGIPNLMKYIVIGNVIVYLLAMFSSAQAVAFLGFNWSLVLQGEVWRLITFIFVSGYSSVSDILWLALFLYFYYWVGSALEREWGSGKFTLYYFFGVILTLAAAIITSIATGKSVSVYGTNYVNLSMFFAFAMLYPDMQVLLFFFIPLKVKWLAWFDAAFFALTILRALFTGSLLGALLPVVAMLNFLIFFWPDIAGRIGRRRDRARYRTAPQTIQFKEAARHQQETRGYHHKCCVCGRTDTDYPDLEFRYCSKCVGYHCFCQDHIFNHVHFQE
jgi:hypothetical protein